MADDSLMIHMAAVKFLDAKKYESHSEGFCISPVTKDELALIFCVNGEASIAEHRVLIGKQQVFLARLWQPIHVYDNALSHTMIHIRFTCTQETAADAKAEQTGKCFFHMSKHPVVIPSTGDIYRLLAEILYERFRKNPGYQKTCTSMMQILRGCYMVLNQWECKKIAIMRKKCVRILKCIMPKKLPCRIWRSISG